jgi:hypothetical protein
MGILPGSSFSCWSTGVGRTLAIGPRNSKLVTVFLQHRHNGNGIFSLSTDEELGWRGYLQGRLIERFGLSRGIIVLGLLASFWHLPLLLAGYNYPQHPVLGAFVLSPLLLVAASFFMAWLTLGHSKLWPAALAHGAGDSIQGGLMSSIKTSLPGLYVYLTELAFIIIIGVIFFILLIRQRGFPSKLRQAMDIHLLGDVPN